MPCEEVKLVFAGREVKFVDRKRALKQVSDWAEKGTWDVHVIYSLEECGKTALLKQVKAILEESSTTTY